MTILREGLEHKYEELFIRRIKVGVDYLTVSVVKPVDKVDSGLTIYYRANLRLLNKFLSPEESKVCLADFENLKSEGIHAYGIAKHVVEPEDALDFLRAIN